MNPSTRQNLSSASLFHFVSRREYLIDILRRGFQARYCLEEYLDMPDLVSVPMKCFCDIPLGIIKSHLSSYGRYGVGVSKDFAIRHGISPVVYVHHNSQAVQDYVKRKVGNKSVPPLFPFIKRYNNSFEAASSSSRKEIRYYDEREWRYVPSSPKMKFHRGACKKSAQKETDGLNKQLGVDELRLPVNLANDVSYIFVERDDDVSKVIREIRGLRKYTDEPESADLLVSKILTASQIHGDF